MAQRLIASEEEFEELAAGSKLFTARSGEVWWVTGRQPGHGPRVEGSGGGYSHVYEFLKYEGHATVLWEPTP